jgi:hypothetical protein
MRTGIHKSLFWWLTSRTPEEEEQEELADAQYIKMAKNDTFRPLREVLAEIEAEERVELPSSIEQTG